VLVIPANAVFLRARMGRPALAIAALSAGGALVALLVAGFQFVMLNNTRPGGWELSPIHFADLSVTLGFLGLGGLLVETPPRWALLLWLAPPAGLLAAILSGTRSALLVAAGEAILALVFFVRRYKLSVRVVLGAVIALIAIAVVMALLAPALHLSRAFDVVGVFEQLLSDQHVTDYTAGVRLDQYQAALKSIANAPIFGHGWRDQVQSALQYMSPASQRAYAIEHWGYIHDEFLSFSVGMGFFGALSWVLLTAYPIAALLRAPASDEPSARNYMTLVAWAGIVIGGLSDVLFNTELTKTFYCFIPGAIVILCSTRPLSLQHPAVRMDSVHASIGETP
jgi:O-antigen ligase